jgi:hypothetical protein
LHLVGDLILDDNTNNGTPVFLHIRGSNTDSSATYFTLFNFDDSASALAISEQAEGQRLHLFGYVQSANTNFGLLDAGGAHRVVLVDNGPTTLASDDGNVRVEINPSFDQVVMCCGLK